MRRLLVLVPLAIAALLALRRPAPPPAIASVPAEKPASSQHSRKGQSLANASSQSVVYVVGAIARAGLYRLPSGARVNDAIERAGGLLESADPASVNLAERVSDGEEIRVLRVGEAVPARPRSKKGKKAHTLAAAAAPVPIDLNTADESALASIPGIGPTLAARIVEYRRINGPFASLDELADVAGMTQRRIDAMGTYVTVGS